MIRFWRAVTLFALCACAFSATVIPIADIAGTGAVVPFSGTIVGQTAIWVQVVCTGTGTARLGSTTVAPAANIGVPCAAGGSFFYPAVPVSPGVFSRYDLSTLTALIPSGLTLSVTYAR